MKLKELLPIIRDDEFNLLTGYVGEDCRTVTLGDNDSFYKFIEEELESEVKDISVLEIWI